MTTQTKNLIPIMGGNGVNSPAQVREWFIANGISQTKWCQENGFSLTTLAGLLRSRKPVLGTRGQSHTLAVAIGLKPVPNIPPKQWSQS
jgi:gp16 family phage-associated protein